MEPISQLESDFSQEFTAWQTTPTPQTTGQLLRKLQPTIDRGIRANVGPRVSPVLRSQARKLTLSALDTYEPHRAKLGTHVTNHLKGLRRAARQQRQVLRMPERVSLDQTFLLDAEEELQDKLGYEPSATELADHTGISKDRIRYVRGFRHPVAEGSLLAATVSGEDAGFAPAVTQDDTPLVLEATYNDLGTTNQKIMDWTLGLHGVPKLSNQAIASRLGLTPGAVSQRKAVIQKQINDMKQYDLF